MKKFLLVLLSLMFLASCGQKGTTEWIYGTWIGEDYSLSSDGSILRIIKVNFDGSVTSQLAERNGYNWVAVGNETISTFSLISISKESNPFSDTKGNWKLLAFGNDKVYIETTKHRLCLVGSMVMNSNFDVANFEVDLYKVVNSTNSVDNISYTTKQKLYVINTSRGRWPFTSERLIGWGDIYNLSKWDLTIMRNEIYARHGRKFKRADLRQYFEAQPWYMPMYDEVTLTPIENKNVAFIRQYE